MSPHDQPAGDDVLVATSSQTVGPFFHFGLATNPALGTIAPDDGAAERIRLRIRVLDGDAVPVPDALIELYHAGRNGAYPASTSASFTGFGRLATDVDGVCMFETSMPGLYMIGFASTRDFGPFYGFTKGCPSSARIAVAEMLR